MRIIVNTVERDLITPHVTYADIVMLADERGTPTVTYRGPLHGDSRRQGTMWPGKSIEAEDGMVFSVVHTGSA